MSRTNQILIWITLFVLLISLTVAYFWPEEQPQTLVEVEAPEVKETLQVVKMNQLVVTVLNGSLKDGMAAKTQEFLESNQLYVARIGNAPTRNYQVSEIIYHPEASQAAYELAKLLQINKRTPAQSFESRLFVTVVIGADFAEPALARSEQ
jgi:hypothetical protein